MASGDRKLYLDSVTITSGTSLSTAISVNNAHLCGIIMPGGWDAAALTFQVSRDGGTTFANFYLNGAEYSKAEAAASRDIGVFPADFAGVDQIKVRSGTSAAAVNQTADRIIRLVARPYA